jgi:hypothetical protein
MDRPIPKLLKVEMTLSIYHILEMTAHTRLYYNKIVDPDSNGKLWWNSNAHFCILIFYCTDYYGALFTSKPQEDPEPKKVLRRQKLTYLL